MTKNTPLSVIDRLTPENIKPLYSQIFADLDNTFYKMNRMRPHNNYPPHNVLRNKDGGYTIQLAVAGFEKEELDVSLNNNMLTIKGQANFDGVDDESLSEAEIIHKGIASRDFEVTYALTDKLEVGDVSLNNGILTIEIKRVEDQEDVKKLEIK